MANLGTLDMANAFAQQIGQNVAKNGSDTDKIAYLLGSYLGNYFGNQRKKKDNAKYDEILAQAKANPNDPGFVADENGIRTTNAPQLSNQDYNYVMNGGDPTVSVGVDAQELLTRPAADYGKFEEAKSTQQAFNPNYNEQYIRNEARKRGISSAVVDQRMAETKADIAQTANAMLLPEIQKNLYGYTDDKGNRIAPTVDSQLKAMSQLNELSKYSPDIAKTYQALAVQGLQGDTNFARQKELAQIKANNAAASESQKLQNRIAYRQATAGLGRATNNNAVAGGMKSSDYINLGKRHTELGTLLQEKYPDGRLPANDPDVIQYMNIGQMIGVNRPQSTTQQQPTQQQSAPKASTQTKPEQKEKAKPAEDSNVDKNGYNNKWSNWDINSKDLAAIRWEYVKDPEAFRKKYGFNTYSEYEDWLVNSGE